MSQGKSQTTAWGVECTWPNDEPIVLLSCDSEADAIANWLVGEYELGFVTTIYRPEVCRG